MTTARPSGFTMLTSRSASWMMASSWICGRDMIQSVMREYLDSPMRLESLLGMTPIHSRPMMGHRWWLQALRTVIGPMIMSSLRCDAFGNSVTRGMGTKRPRNTSVTYILATRRAVSRVL